MKINFRKITALATSVLMIGMTAGVAAAANYPAPFIENGAANVAIVFGTGSGVSYLDQVQAGYISTDLQNRLGGGSGGTDDTVTGEAYALFTGSSKIYMNETLNYVRTTLTDTELPTLLADGDFEGNVAADLTQTITMGSNPRLVFGEHPTSNDDPVVAFDLGTNANTQYIYNMSVTFDQAVNLTHTDSVGESMVIFGKEYTVGAGTTNTKLYMYESSETVALSIGGDDPASQTVTVNGATYTVELVSASDTDATIKVIDSTGASQTKTIAEDNSKKVQGIDIAVDLADETTNYGLKAQITVGANKILLQSGNPVKIGSDETTLEQSYVYRTGAAWGNATAFTIQVAAEDDDVDALVIGQSFVDPVFGTFKVDFTTLENDDDREIISVGPSGSEKATLEFTTHDGKSQSINWFYNDTTATPRLADSSGDNFNVREMTMVNKSQYVVVGNENEGYLLELSEFTNSSDSTSDTIKFRNAFDSEDTYTVTGITTEGSGSLIVGGKTYTVTYVDASAGTSDYTYLNYPDSTGNQMIIYPTIETSKGAKLAFYEPLTINLANWDGGSNMLSGLLFPDGDGYETIAVEKFGAGDSGAWNFTDSGTVKILNTTTAGDSEQITIGELTYNITADSTANTTKIYLQDSAGVDLTLPGLYIFEEKDDNSAYHALIVEMDDMTSSTDKVGVTDVQTTWNNDGSQTPDWDNIQLESDDDLYKDMDLWGAVVTYDKSDTDQVSVEISYPDEQVSANVYVAENSATITAGSSGTTGTGTPLGEVLVTDMEVSSVSAKNLIVVGGSCINSAAATLVGGAYCGAAFTEATTVGAGEFIIKGYAAADQSLTSKLALLVAGYNKEDTVNAATYLRKQAFDTSKAYKGTTATSATEIVATA